MRMFITSKNKYLSNDMKIFGTCSIPLRFRKPPLSSLCYDIPHCGLDLWKNPASIYFLKIRKIVDICCTLD